MFLHVLIPRLRNFLLILFKFCGYFLAERCRNELREIIKGTPWNWMFSMVIV